MAEQKPKPLTDYQLEVLEQRIKPMTMIVRDGYKEEKISLNRLVNDIRALKSPLRQYMEADECICDTLNGTTCFRCDAEEALDGKL